LINGLPVEYKHPMPGANAESLSDMVQQSLRRGGQARHIVLDARDTGLSRIQAEEVLGSARNNLQGPGGLDAIEIIGDGFFLQATRDGHRLDIPRPDLWRWGGLGN
jgi:hypothetical protein